MRAFITGGAGFIGSHLADTLLAAGHSVTVMDDFSSGQTSNLNAAAKSSRFSLLEGDIRHSDQLAERIESSDLVFHFAAAVGVRQVIDSPLRTIDVNVHGTQIVLNVCAKLGKKFILASTSEVYGKNPKGRFSEEDDLVLGPTHIGRWSYACAKAMDEFLVHASAKAGGFRFVILRYFNVIGPRQRADYGMVLPRFIEQARSGKPLTYFGHGEISRCFMHVQDAVDATVRLALIPAAENQVINVGNPHPLSIMELADRVRQITRSKSIVQSVNPLECYDHDFADMSHRIPDTRRMESLSGFLPRFTVDDAIQSMSQI